MKYCDATCKPCIYSTVLSNWPWACAYILTTGVARGCSPGKGCIRRKEGEKLPTIDSIVFHGNDKNKTKPNPKPQRKGRIADYNKEYYMAHREAILARQKARKAEKAAQKPPKPEKPKSNSSDAERKRSMVIRTQAIWQGRQRAVIEAYMKEHDLSTAQFAVLVGVTERTIRQWKREGNQADWNKLAQVGIKKPEIE